MNETNQRRELELKRSDAEARKELVIKQHILQNVKHERTIMAINKEIAAAAAAIAKFDEDIRKKEEDRIANLPKPIWEDSLQGTFLYRRDENILGEVFRGGSADNEWFANVGQVASPYYSTLQEAKDYVERIIESNPTYPGVSPKNHPKHVVRPSNRMTVLPTGEKYMEEVKEEDRTIDFSGKDYRSEPNRSVHYSRNSKYWVQTQQGTRLYRVNGDSPKEDRIKGGVRTMGNILDGSYKVEAKLFSPKAAAAQFRNVHLAQEFIENNADSIEGYPSNFPGDPFGPQHRILDQGV